MNDYIIYKGQLYSEDELYHHGVKGQKWGVRRYQNEDGTLTPAGIKRYKREQNKIISKGIETGARDRTKLINVNKELNSINRKMIKADESSKKSLQERKSLLENYRDDKRKSNELAIKNLEAIRKSVINKYGDKGINSISTTTLETGEIVVDSLTKALQAQIRNGGALGVMVGLAMEKSAYKRDVKKYAKSRSLSHDDELYHHGIKGQKWGVRRFQNKNGSLTPEGKERYGKGSQTRKYTPEEEAFLSGKKSFDESVEAIAGKDGSRLYPVCECSALHIRNKIHTAVESNDFDKLSDVSDYDTFFTDVKSKEGVYLGYSAVFDEGSDRFGKYITDDDLKGASLRFSACRDTGNGTFAVFDDVEIPFDMNDKHKVQRVIIDAKIVGNTSKRKSVSGEALIECSVSDIMCGYIPYDKIAIVTKKVDA